MRQGKGIYLLAVMKMKRQRLTILALLASAVIYMVKSAAVQGAVREALSLCVSSVVPALLPFLVISSLLISCGFGEWAGKWLAGGMEVLFGLPGCAGSALVLGLTGGYPVGATAAAELYRQDLLTKEETSRLLAFCNNSNPVFLVTVLGRGIFGSGRTGMWLWLIHVASALLTGMLFRRRSGGRGSACPRCAVQTVSLSRAVVEAVRGSAWSCVGICGFVTVFYVLSRPLADLGGAVGAALTGMVELFSLTPLLREDGGSFVIAAACAGFGGVSVLCQTASVLEGSGLSLRWCVTGKMVQGLLSALLALLVWQWL